MKKNGLLLSAISLTVLLFSNPSFAKGDEENLSKLGAFKRTDTGALESVPQDTPYAANLRKMLQNIRLPEGFKIELFAVVPDARNMAVSRNKATVWVGTRKNTVWSPIRLNPSARASSSIFPMAHVTRRMASCSSRRETAS